jgi:hypothetical protein
VSSTRPSSSVRSTILSLVSPLCTQRREPWASQSCLVEAARMFFTLSRAPALRTLACCSLAIHRSVQKGDAPKFAQPRPNTHALLGVLA